MSVGCLLGYIRIFLYEKEDLGVYDERGVRIGVINIIQTNNKTEESIINDGNE